MTKHEPNLTADQTNDTDLERRVEAAILEHMARHDGAMPTINALNLSIKTSNSRLCPAARAVKMRLMAVQTKLASMQDIPDALTLAHEQVLKEMWAKAREYQNEEIVDLKRSQTARDAMHRDEGPIRLHWDDRRPTIQCGDGHPERPQTGPSEQEDDESVS
jgi:hypothetical protein